MPSGASTREIAPAELRDAIKAAMAEKEFDPRARVVVTIPSGKVFFSTFRTELSRERDVRQLLRFEVEDDFPIPFDELTTDICGHRPSGQNDWEFLVCAVSRSEVRGWVAALQEAGIECSAVSADVCALQAVASLTHGPIRSSPSLVVHVDRCRTLLAVIEDNNLIGCRCLNPKDPAQITVPTLEREIELTLRAVCSARVPRWSSILLSGTNGLIDQLAEELLRDGSSEILTLNPFNQIDGGPQQPKDGELAIALGLALMGIQKDPRVPDFLAVDRAKAGQRAGTKRNACVFGVLLLAIAALFGTRLFLQLHALEKENQRIEQDIAGVFLKTLPDEKKIVNALAQMTERLEALKSQYSTLRTEISDRAPSLRILERLSERIAPDQGVSVSSLSIAPKAVRLSGAAPSFGSVENVAQSLRQITEFDSVEVQNTSIDPGGGKVRFTLLMTMGLN